MQSGTFVSRCVSGVTELPVSMFTASLPAVPTLGASHGSPLNGNPFERESATDEHLPLVQFLARQLHARLPQHVELDDLVSAGTLGLLDAVARFDGDKAVQFRSYAQIRIRGAMLDSLRAADWSPRTLRRQGRLVEQAKQVLSAQGVASPDEAQIAEQMAVSVQSLRQLLDDLKRLEVGRLDSQSYEDAGEQLIDSVPGPASEDPLLRYMQGELRETLIGAIDTLPEKERLVLTLYYYEELTMKEISEVLGVVGSRVSQLHASAIFRLKKSFPQGNQVSTRRVKPSRCTALMPQA